MTPDILAISQRASIIHAPVEMIDLGEWMFSLSDGEYQACSPDHVAAGANVMADGRRMSINVETIGGDVLIQRYIEQIAEPSHCQVRSMSDFLHRLGPATLDVTWDVSVRPLPGNRAEFNNTVIIRNTPELMALLDQHNIAVADIIPDLQVMADRHNEGETPMFALNIEARARGLGPRTVAAPVDDVVGHVLADTAVSAVMDVPVDAVDLSEWLFGLTEADYRLCSAAHITAGTTHAGNGRRVSINVEQPGGLIVQHYQEVTGKRAHVRMVSPRSDIFMGAHRSTLHVVWDLSVAPSPGGRSIFTNHVIVSTTPEFEAFLASAGVSIADAQAQRGPIVVAHNADETPKFATDIEQKAKLAMRAAA